MKWNYFKFLGTMKVGRQLVHAYLLTGFLPICIICGMFFIYMENTLQERELHNLENSFEQAVQEVDNELQLYGRMSDYIVFNQTVSVIINSIQNKNYEDYRRVIKEFDPMMDSLRYFYPNLKQITIYTKNDSVSHGNYIRSFSEIQDQSWAEQEGWRLDRVSHSIQMTRNMMFLEPVGGGILHCVIDYETLLERLKFENYNSYSLYIYQGDELLYENDSNEELPIPFTDFCRYRDRDSSVFLIREAELKQTGWMVGCILPKHEFLHSLTALVLQTVIIWLLCIILSLAFIFHFSRRFSGRIERLEQAVRAMEAGNLDVEVVDAQQDEIGNLTVGFNHMVKELRRLIKEVYQGQIAQKKYEMTALRAQINPHFLYNSLSLINWKALEIDAQDISKITLALSRYYRTSLNKGKNVMPIREELDNVRAYLEIQEMFHDFSFDIEVDVDEAILDYETLNLVLQPLAENAIHHGIDRLRKGRGKIRIEGGIEDDVILLKVKDNGIGMSQEKADTILGSKSSGYGVQNVNSRIHLQYGEEYGLRVLSQEGVGTEIQVRFPCRKFEK